MFGAFGSKREMFVSALRSYCEAWLKFAENELRIDEKGIPNRLRSYVYGKLDVIVASKRGCLIAKATAELAGQDGDVDGIVRDFYRRYEDVFVQAIRRGQRTSEIPQTIDARRWARMLVAALRGLETMGKAGVPATTLRSIAGTALNYGWRP